MTEVNKNEAIAEMQKIARSIQRGLSKYGDAIAMGTEPSVVVFQANVNPANPEAQRLWHAGIVYRQHVATTPEVALKSLGNTILEAASRLEAKAASGTDEPVKELAGGGTFLPDIWE